MTVMSVAASSCIQEQLDVQGCKVDQKAAEQDCGRKVR